MADQEESTRQRVLRILKERGGDVAIKELCGDLGLSPMSVHRQLDLLEKEGLVFSQARKLGKGRPPKRYFLTQKGHEGFERSYDDLASDVLVALRSLDGREKIKELLDLRKERHLEEARGRILGATLEARIHSLTAMLTEDGYMADWQKLSSNRYEIRLMNCAVDLVARRFPQLCLCEEEFLSEVLGTRVRRNRHILQKDQFCSYLVERGGGRGLAAGAEA
jgi:predicted ArsR family transcriptional regulator